MKCYSKDKPPTTPLKWLEGEWALFINHKENAVTSEDDEGRRWEAEHTVVRDLTAEAAIEAFTRLQQDPELDYQVYTSSKVNAVYALDVKKDYPVKASTTIFEPLPTSGALKRGQIYSYANGAVMVVKDHDRTIYASEETPDLFNFYRDNADGLEWVKNEKVEIGWKRTYDGKLYQCIQAHVTYDGYFPTLTIGVLWVEIPQQGEKPPQWNTVNWINYIIGYEVYDNGKVWRAKNTTHTWIQPALTGNGAISWEFVKDWV